MTSVAMPPAARAGPADTPLPRRGRMLYAAASLGVAALTQSRSAWLFYAYAPPPESGRQAMLPVAVVGVVLAATRLVDAFHPPPIGWLSDRSRSRWGRRLPWVLVGTPLWAILAVVTILPPPTTSTATTALAIGLALEVFNVFGTVSGVPYDALLPDVARSADDRLALVGTRTYFGIAGTAIGLVGSGPLVDRVGMVGMMVAVAALALATRCLGVLGVRDRLARDAPPVTASFRQSVAATFGNRHFLAFLPAFVLFSTGFQLLTGALPFYAAAILRPADLGVAVSLMAGVGIVATVAAVPFFTRFARRTSAGTAYRLALLLSAASLPLLAVAGLVPGVPPLAQVLVVMAAVGAPMAGVTLFPGALSADIIDSAAAADGQRREGMFVGVQGSVERLTSAFSPLVLGGLLLLGATPSQSLGVRLVGPVAALLVAAGWLAFRSYDLGAAPAAEPGGRDA